MDEVIDEDQKSTVREDRLIAYFSPKRESLGDPTFRPTVMRNPMESSGTSRLSDQRYSKAMLNQNKENL